MAENIKKGPIFIGGLDRSGKTLLRALLVSNPNIAIPEIGSNYWTFFYRQYGDLRKRANFERCLAAMLRYTHVCLLNPDVEQIRREFGQGEPTYANLFRLFNEQYARRQGKTRWGDQTGLIERYARHIFAAYPGSKMIHMLRDPRDRYEASLAHAPNGKGRAGGATARWLYSLNLARSNLKRFPDRYRIVRYETLVTQPEKTLREICALLDEEYTPDLLTMNGAPAFQGKVRRGKYGNRGPQLISTEFIGRYRKTIPPIEIAFIQSMAGKDMLAYGYDLEPIRFSSGERMKFLLAGWPDNAGRMMAWLGAELLQQNLPEQFGRKPPADKVR
jgi:sulfotransferase family protein